MPTVAMVSSARRSSPPAASCSAISANRGIAVAPDHALDMASRTNDDADGLMGGQPELECLAIQGHAALRGTRLQRDVGRVEQPHRALHVDPR